MSAPGTPPGHDDADLVAQAVRVATAIERVADALETIAQTMPALAAPGRSSPYGQAR